MRVQRHLSFAVAVALTASLLTVSAGTAVAASSTSTPPATTTSTPPSSTTPVTSTEDYTRPDVTSARLAAQLLGHRIEVTGLEAETSTTWVNPDGTMTTDLAATPVREMVGGSWQNVDPDLVATPAGVTAKVAKIGAVFSPGGSQPLYAVPAGATGSVSLNWPTVLPAPTLSGNVATYHDVQPGVDVVVTSGVTGFDVQIVLTARPTGAPTFHLPVALAGGVTSAQGGDGVVRYSTADGTAALVSDTPRMWDATRSTISGQPTVTSAVPIASSPSAGGSTLTVSPPASFLTDPSTTYPVTIDPGLALTSANYMYTDAGNGSASNFDNSTTSNGVTGITQVGLTNGGANVYRAFYQFNTSSLAGVSVTGATLSIQEVGATSCTPSEVDVWDASNFTSANSWNSPPNVYNEWASTSVAAGYSSACPSGTVTFTGGGASGKTITQLAQAWSTNGQSQHSVEVRSPDESDNLGWKMFAGNSATLSVTYGATPGVPAPTSLLPCVSACGAGGTMAWTNTTTPTLSAASVDPNGATVQLQYQVWAGSVTSQTTEVASGSTVFVPSGQSTTWTVPASTLSNGSAYVWRVQGYNGTNYGLWSAWAPFSVDTTAPAPPVISPISPGPATGWIAWTDASTDLAAYGYELDADNNPTWGNTTVTGVWESGLAPGYHTLSVFAQDLAGNTTENTLGFTVGSSGYLDSPADQTRTGQSVTLIDGNPSGYPYVTYEYRTGSAGSPVQPITVPGSGSSPVSFLVGGGPVNAWPVSVSSTLVWNMRSTITADGPIQIEACFSNSLTNPPALCSAPSNVQLTSHTFSPSDATAQVGPGIVALLTGDYAVPASDVNVPTYLGSLTLGRTFTTLAPNQASASPAAGVFGPGWQAAFYGPNAGEADATLVDNSLSGYVTLIGADRLPEIYTSSGGSTYTGAWDTATEGSTITKNSTTQFTLLQADGTQTVYTNTGGIWGTSEVIEDSGTSAAVATNYTLDGSGRVTQILAPVPAGVTCTSPLTTAGCRTLTFTYASTTTAVTGTPGDYAGQLKSASFTTYNPVSSAMATVVVANYLYDTTGHLVNEWDPRVSPNLLTTYTYNSSGQLITITPAGLATTTLGYDSQGRLTTVAHPDPSGPTATSTIVYGDKLPYDSTGPINLTSSVVAAWGETTTTPVTAAAVFGPDHVPAATPTSVDWPYASLTYMDVNGRPVNTASYGNGNWQVSATQYDAYGNAVWSITPGNLSQAITPTSATDPYVATVPTEAARANLLATVSTYGSPSELTSSLGPTHPTQTTTVGLIEGREHVVNSYDQGQPGTGPADQLLTDTVHSTQALGGTDYDSVETAIGYGAVATGDVTGWVLHKPTSTVTFTSSSVYVYTRYNNVGQVIESRLPMGAANASGVGDDAYSTDTTYYTPGTTGPCVSNSLAGLVCSVGPAAQPTTGKPLPVTTTTYNMYDEPLVVTETAGSVVRTTTLTYDAAGRSWTSAVTVTPSGSDGTETPSHTFGYDPTTGLPATTTDSNSHVVTTTYDSLGRVHTYTDATGALTTTTYDLDSRPITVVDPKGSTTYTYDGTTGEHRGLVTTSTDSVAGSFTGTYTNDGQLATQTYPGGLTATYSYDNAGNQTQIAYAKSGTSWVTFTAERDEDRRIVSGNNAAGMTSTYSYDNLGRLTSATDNTGTACNARAYAFNNDSDRTSLTTSTFAPTGGACTGSGTPTTVNHSYDQADRITDTGYNYDDFGRTLSVPSVDAGGGGALTLGYYTNDLAQSVSQTVAGVAATKTFGLDPNDRVLTEATGGGATVPGAPTAVTATAGNASATVSWTAPASNGGSAITAYVVTASPGGATASTTSGTTATVNGLTNGTAYTFTVQAVNAAGIGTSSSASSSVTPANGGIVANTAEGGTAGTTVTAANSGGTSGDAFNQVARGTGATLVYATAAAAHGTLGYSLTGASGTASFVGWNGYSATSIAVRFYYNPGTTLPSSVMRLLDIRNSTGTAARIELSASNQLFVQNTAGTTLTTFPTALSANTWYRIEMTISISATAATIDAAYYLKDATAPVSTAYATTTGNTGTANITQVSVGSSASATWTGTSWFDDIAVHPGTTSYIGPVAVAPGAPTAVAAVPGNGSAIVSWTPPASTGGAPITSYTVTASPGTATASTTGAALATVSGLTNGTAYIFTVKATNSAGTSTASTASTAVTPAPPGTTLTDHFDGGSDSPAWTATTDGSWTRNVTGLDGNTDASVAYAAAGGTTTTTLQLMDLHGDVAATATPTGTGTTATYTYDEFGNPTNTNALRYGWLGGKDRAQTGIGNLTLMGQRLYNPGTGRFLQTDPEPGGSCNPYDYGCQDPINNYDLSGDCFWCALLGGEAAVALPDEWNPVGWVADAALAATVVVVAGYYTVKGTYDLGQGIARMAEHKKNKRPSTSDKHSKGRGRVKRDKGGEKGDSSRTGNPNKGNRPQDRGKIRFE